MTQNVLASMKTPVTDVAVDEYVARILAGGPLGKVFPGKLSECDFTPIQREKIRKARAEKRTSLKNGRSTVVPIQLPPNPKLSPLPEPKTPKALTKLRKMLYLQGGTCFFCGMPLKEEDANIEHLNPKSLGGMSTEDNEVVCHKTLNHAFGNMDLKRKFEFVLKAKGAFRCPGI
jgi:5-methylcytosine-specific restriction endonuclease McrA